jgi:hypothetical protein
MGVTQEQIKKVSQEIATRTRELATNLTEHVTRTEIDSGAIRQGIVELSDKVNSRVTEEVRSVADSVEDCRNQIITEKERNESKFQKSEQEIQNWKCNLESKNVQVRYTAVRHPQSNPSERCMKESSKFFRIYCNENHKKWAELIPHIETWLNNTVASATGFTPTELMFGGKGPNIFEELLPEMPEGRPVVDDIQAKIAQAYEKMVRKINSKKRDNRKGRAHWKPKVEDKVLLRTQPMSDAGAGITAKFLHP